MTVTALITSRWLKVHGRPASDAVPTSAQIIQFCWQQFDQPLTETLAVRVRLTLVALAEDK